MSEWGLSVGLCFQLMDDLIDVLSDSKTLGKPTGSDVAQGKQTLMVIHALNQPDSEVKTNLLNVLGMGEEASSEMIEQGIESLRQLGSIAKEQNKENKKHKNAHPNHNHKPQKHHKNSTQIACRPVNC